jgi:hypothetical protein
LNSKYIFHSNLQIRKLSAHHGVFTVELSTVHNLPASGNYESTLKEIPEFPFGLGKIQKIEKMTSEMIIL